jgi:hypothetical protein
MSSPETAPQEVLVESQLDELFDRVMFFGERGRWTGLPDHLGAAYYSEGPTEQVNFLNWASKESIQVTRPRRLVSNPDWTSVVSGEHEKPLYKIWVADMFGSLMGVVLPDNTTVSTYKLHYEVSPGKLRFYAHNIEQDRPVVDCAISDSSRYPIIAERLLSPLELGSTLAMPELNADDFK